jgi:hypothetical protein
MTTPHTQAVIIGTRMSESAMALYLGHMPQQYNKLMTDLLREICILRNYFNKTDSRKIRFYRITDVSYEALTDGRIVTLEVISTGAQWHPDVAMMFLDYKNAEDMVNSKYPYGTMDQQTRVRYVHDFSKALGDQFKKVDLLN